MSRVNDIQTGIWGETEFLDLSVEAKVIYVWSFTNPLCGMAGLYKVSKKTAAFQTGVVDVDATLAELQAARFVYFQDAVLWCRTRVRHLRTRTPQIARSIAKDVALINEDHPLREAFLGTYADEDWLREALALIHVGNPAHVSTRRRHEVYTRDDFLCVDCGSEDDLTVDHIIPRSAGGTAEVANLQTLCRSCNSSKGVSLGDAPIEPLIEPHRPSADKPSQRGSVTLQGKGNGQGLGSGLSVDITPVEEEGKRASATHPNLTEVLAVYSALPADHAVEVDEYQLNSACLAQRDLDQVAAANTAVGWQTSPEMANWTTASSLQRSALNSMAKRQAQLDGIREAATKAGIPAPGASKGRSKPIDDPGKYDRALGLTA